MRLQEFFATAIQAGIDADPRGREAVERQLADARKAYDELREEERAAFDIENLSNPYADSRILYGGPDRNVRTVFVGIDVETAELVLADRLKEKGGTIDLVVAHHPEGRAYASIYEVMKMQAEILHGMGVPINVAESLLSGRMKEVERSLLPANHSRAVDAARLLDIPFVCLHTPADNRVADYLQKRFDAESPRKLKDVVSLLKEIPEYKAAARNNAGPRIIVGSEDQRAGKVFVDMTGGTSGSKEIFEKLAQSGVGTVVGMHLTEDHRKEAEKHHVRVVIAGHISSDALGLNLLLDAIEEQHHPLEIIEGSGFTRVKRNSRAG